MTVSLAAFPAFIQRAYGSDWTPFNCTVTDTAGGTPWGTGQFDVNGNIIPNTGPSNRGITVAGANNFTGMLATGGPTTFRVWNAGTGVTLAQSAPFSVGDIRAYLGQSNAQNMWAVNPIVGLQAHPATAMYQGGTWKIPTGAGLITMLNALQALTSVPQAAIADAAGGTALCFESSVAWADQSGGSGAPDYWMNASGPSWSAFASDLGALGNQIAGVIWDQGEQDALKTRSEVYAAALDVLFRRITNLVSGRTLRCALVELGNTDQMVFAGGLGLPAGGIDREAIVVGQQLFTTLHNAYIAAKRSDLPRDGTPHLSPNGYQILGARLGKKIADVEYGFRDTR